MQKIALALCTAALTLSSTSDAEIYKWTDERGHVHYGDKAPKDVGAVEVSEHLKEAATIYTPAPPAPMSAPSRPDAKPMPEFLDGDLPVLHAEQAPRGMSKTVRVDIDLVDYKLSRADNNKIDQEIQLMYGWFVDQLGWDIYPRYPLKIRVFGSAAAFSAYAPSLEPWNAQRSHYNPSTREIVMRGEPLTDDTIATLRHEASHAILGMQLQDLPFWINEGLAEVFRSSGALRGRLNVTPDPEWVEMMKLKLRDGSLQPLDYYFKIPNSQWRMVRRREERSYYMISWAMMSFLLSTPNGKICLHGIMRDARKSKSGFGALDEAFEINCGESKRLDANWRMWVQSL
jgi:hypothetical protein